MGKCHGNVQMNKFEISYWKVNQLVIGIDEAGRGPMAGPLVVCGVVLPLHYSHPLINDSKKLTSKQREHCYKDIKKDALLIIVEIVSAKDIDKVNIYKATQQAMERIMHTAQVFALIDAMPVHSDGGSLSIIKGDQQSISIAASSIIAKVMRDKIMEIADEIYPQYGFKKHKGYPTKAHKQAMNEHGLSPLHRRSFHFKSSS